MWSGARRDLSESHYVYWWVDGIHTGQRSENLDGQCLLVIIGVKPDGSKERVAFGDEYREMKAWWLQLLLDLKKRGPRLAVGNGAMGFWAALEEVSPATRGHQRKSGRQRFAHGPFKQKIDVATSSSRRTASRARGASTR
jgi:transposase-like protein